MHPGKQMIASDFTVEKLILQQKTNSETPFPNIFDNACFLLVRQI